MCGAVMRTSRRFVKYLALFAAITMSAPAQGWMPAAETIGRLESTIRPGDIPQWGKSEKYPNDHSPLVAEYARFYTGETVNGKRVILGEFVIPVGSKQKPPGIYIVRSKRDFPIISDGGCGIVHVVLCA